MKTHGLLMAAGALLAVCAQAQEKKPAIVAEGGAPDERASARILYWDQRANSAAGQIAINYGRPVWQKDYEDPAKFDAITKSKVWRMGSNFWSEWYSDVPVKVSGRDVASGSYFLGLHRSADGSKWTLAFIDPAVVRKARIDAFDIRKASIRFEVPMTFEKSDARVEKLTITLSHPQENIRNVTLKVAWGTMTLTAPIHVALAE